MLFFRNFTGRYKRPFGRWSSTNKAQSQRPIHLSKAFLFGGATLFISSAWLSLSSSPSAENPDVEEMTEEKAGSVRPELPTYELNEITTHKTAESRIWVTYRNGVYDITDFIESHPGGLKIMLAAGGSIDPFWSLYQIHKTDEVAQIIEQFRIGNYFPPVIIAEPDDPYGKDPIRHPALLVRNAKPFNAETPPVMLSEFITPNDLFYVRNHLPVPQVDPAEYKLVVQHNDKTVEYTLDELKKFPTKTITATVQCAGQRRTELKEVRPVQGLDWKVGAISTATWTGPMLSDILQASVGVEQGYQYDSQHSNKHVQFEGLDCDFEKCYGASIPIVKALDPRGDVILAFEMNGVEIPADHGYPIRAIVPGTVGARNVKWLRSIKISDEESWSHWQRKDYKGFPPNVIDPRNAVFETAQSIQELPVTSAITEPENGFVVDKLDDTVEIKGFAWSGGGRDIFRVDVSPDGGKTWQQAELIKPLPQEHNRAWAWTPFTATVTVTPEMRGKDMQLCSKAVNSAFDVQPDSQTHLWNFRGVLSNAIHRVNGRVEE